MARTTRGSVRDPNYGFCDANFGSVTCRERVISGVETVFMGEHSGSIMCYTRSAGLCSRLGRAHSKEKETKVCRVGDLSRHGSGHRRRLAAATIRGRKFEGGRASSWGARASTRRAGYYSGALVSARAGRQRDRGAWVPSSRYLRALQPCSLGTSAWVLSHGCEGRRLCGGGNFSVRR